VALLSRAPLQESVPLLSFVALLGGAVCFAEAAVVVRRFPPVHPVAMNAVGMATGGLLLLIGSVVAGEPAGLPERAPTWIALAYLVLVGSIVVFVLYLFVLRHWAASRAAYAFVISPFVTVVLSAWLDDEPIGPGLVLGGLLILAGVYVGALRAAPKKAPREAATPSSRRGTGVGATVAVVLAAGRGVRLGGVGDGRTKALLPLGGEPIVVRATRPFAAHHAVDEVLVVAPPDDVGRCAAELARADLADVTVIPGGATRHSSEWLAIRGLAARIDRGDIEAVVIHDAARPLYAGEQLEDLLRAALESGGAILAVPIDPEETFARVQDGGAPVPAPTEGTWRAQTPQAFEAGKLLEAFRRAEDEGFEGSDTSSTVERAGVAVRVLHGDPSNIKITYPEDLLLAESFLEWQARPD
jgi:2-C-methyl-D-erythritol 4-phosphate cytidylyltransferase